VLPLRAGGQAGLSARETLAARKAISTGFRLMVDRNASTPAQQRAGVAFSLYDPRHTFVSQLLAAGTPLIEGSAWMGATAHVPVGTRTPTPPRRVYAHATREWRQATLDELAALVAGVDAEFGRRAT
jgi:hypothetical protein